MAIARGMAKQAAARAHSSSDPGPARAAGAIQRTPQIPEMAKSEMSRTPSPRHRRLSGGPSLVSQLCGASANQFNDAGGIVGDNDRLVAICGLDGLAGWGLKLSGVIAKDVVGILEDVAGKDGDDIGIAVDDPGCGEFADASESGGGSRLAAYSRFADDGFGVCNFLFGGALDDPV